MIIRKTKISFQGAVLVAKALSDTNRRLSREDCYELFVLNCRHLENMY